MSIIRCFLRSSSCFLFLFLITLISPLTIAKAEPIIVKAASDQTISPSGPAHRIISLAPSVTEILFAIGLDEEIVGVTAFCDYPEKARSKPKVGGMINPSIEKIIALEPELILAVKGLHGDELASELERLHLPLVLMDVSSIHNILGEINHIGVLVGKTGEAQALVSRMKTRMNRVRDRVQVFPRPRALYVMWNDPLMTVGPESFIGELLEAAGGENIAPSSRAGYVRISMEEVLAKNPEVVIFSSEMGEATVLSEQKKWKGWKLLSAVQNNRLYSINSDIVHRAGPRIVDGIEALSELLHPDETLSMEILTRHSKE